LCDGQLADVIPRGIDRYHRTLARVRCRGTDASLHQVDAGLAWAYTRYLTDPAIADAERVARAAAVGLWRAPEPMPPWEFRHMQAPR